MDSTHTIGYLRRNVGGYGFIYGLTAWLPYCFYEANVSGRKWRCFLLIALSVWAVVLTQFSFALLAIAGLFVLIWMISEKRPRRALIGIAAILLAAVVLREQTAWLLESFRGSLQDAGFSFLSDRLGVIVDLWKERTWSGHGRSCWPRETGMGKPCWDDRETGGIMRIAEINMCADGSTGKIMLRIGEAARAAGHEVTTWSTHLFQVRYQPLPPAPTGHIYYGSYVESAIHYVLGQGGFHGCFYAFATWRLLQRLEKQGIDVLHLHNLHGFCINLPLLFRYIKKRIFRSFGPCMIAGPLPDIVPILTWSGAGNGKTSASGVRSTAPTPKAGWIIPGFCTGGNGSGLPA